MKPDFRPYTKRDREACLGLFDTNVPDYFRVGEKVAFASFIDSSDLPYFVLETADTVVGCGGYAITPGNPVADLCWGMIDHGRHRLGLGELLLLGRLREIVERDDVSGVRLGTSQLTEGFFQRFGFEIRSTDRDGHGRGLDAVEMYLPLSDDVRQEFRERWCALTEAAPARSVLT